ncbi:MAG: CooT family nickel-binding protein [Deltaproteobacteria bacterium]|nr:CooT family nickel-binding protein [Deltaproteobacteria bacterium]MBW1929701.1 CooT family nickel-binding protein [Deltaproteobacteria bacterium]MBW2023991.1 CooT family nickel-binding protein [Deltaproteobacteria bacterium]MBW2125009.1 CooT family nickel-binding protein [Deltaproteobacteria bacterium]RLB17339.1 MAG: RNA-binding protein [Deltaproteobacteria bacterium]
MCEASAYVIEQGQERLIMESVDIVESVDTDTWRLVGIFGDQKTVRGRIKKMNLVNHKIFFESQGD